MGRGDGGIRDGDIAAGAAFTAAADGRPALGIAVAVFRLQFVFLKAAGDLVDGAICDGDGAAAAIQGAADAGGVDTVTLGSQAFQALNVDDTASALAGRAADTGTAGGLCIHTAVADGGQRAARFVAAQVQHCIAGLCFIGHRVIEHNLTGHCDTGTVGAALQDVLAGNLDLNVGAGADLHGGLTLSGLDIHVVERDRHTLNIFAHLHGVGSCFFFRA